MTVAKWMSTKLITLQKDDPVSLAYELLLANDIRHLPVLSRGKLVGILTDRDLHEAVVPCDGATDRRGIYNTLKDISVEKIMTPNPISIHPDASIEQAAQILYERKIDCLTVKDTKGKLVGIITSTDILRAFIELMQVLRGSQRIDIRMNTADYDKVRAIIQNNGGRIISIGITPGEDLSQNIFSFRIAVPDLQALGARLKERGYAVLPID